MRDSPVWADRYNHNTVKLKKLSISQVTQFLTCPRAWLYLYHYGLELDKSEALYFGTTIHEGLAGLYAGKNPLEIVDKFIDTPSKERPKGLNIKDFKEEAMRIMCMYLEKGTYFSPRKDWIERKEVIRLTHPVTKEEISIPFTIKIDLITEDGYIVDHKTASSVSKTQSESYKLQGIAYQMGYRKIFGHAPNGFIQNTIVRQKNNPRVIVEEFHYSIDEEIYLFELVKRMIDLVEKDRAYTIYPMLKSNFPCKIGVLCDIHSPRL